MMSLNPTGAVYAMRTMYKRKAWNGSSVHVHAGCMKIVSSILLLIVQEKNGCVLVVCKCFFN